MDTNWVAITGGPSSGKSTLRESLSMESYATRPDAARVYIQRQKSKGMTLQQIRGSDPLAYQREILKTKLHMYRNMDPQELLVIDGPMEDCSIYYGMAGGDPSDFREYVGRWRYRLVFFCEPSTAERDGVRLESLEEAREIGRGILKLFRRLGYEPVVLGADTDAEERLETAIREIEKLR